MFSSSSFDHTPPSLRTSRCILGRKRQRYHPPSSDFGLSWLLLPLVKPVLVRSSARSNEEITSRFLSKNHTKSHLDSSHGHQPLIERAARNCLGQSLRSVGGTRRGLVGAHARDHHGYEYHLSLSLLSLLRCLTCTNLSQETAGKVVSLYHALVCTHSFSRLTNSCCTHRNV